MRRSLPHIFFGFNVVCALIPLLVDYRMKMLMMAEERTYADFGDMLNFLILGVPAILLGLLTIIAWAGWTFTSASRRASYQPRIWLGRVIAVWVVAILYIRLF
jgi:hypothetical protein